MTKVLNTRKPNPGSEEAVEMGCICPRMDNSYGKGYLGSDNFVIRMDCPIHTSEITIDKKGLHLD